MTFTDGYYDDLEGDARPAWVRFSMRHWKWSAVPGCILLLALISPADDGAEMQQQIVAAQTELASTKVQLGQSQNAERTASGQARVLAGTSAEQASALNVANQSNEALKLDLEAARRVIKGLKAQAISSNEARNAKDAALAEANQSLAEERDKLEQSERELAMARQAGDANERRADLAVAERTNALKDLRLAVAAAKYANEALDLERARAASAASDVDVARRERDAARQASADLSAALEQERQKLTDMSVALTAARKEIDLVKAQSAGRTAQIERAPRARSAAVPLASRDSQPVRQPGLQDKNKAKIARSPKRVLVATTITLPDALLPTPSR
ncbi:hypothetical protein RFM98_18075 [Mesorhizobium sp. VK9D]|uniref:hypothetical protein n=1 Tax=Mesorhizobium australafricanum TaxID=3072311 RepID=UPI002A242596|nr:hypothetical protein [Mesorhizobium sp. VK9D]MDX8454673.1 hypothetical protein [Mesorhizobium sp. VK9D]